MCLKLPSRRRMKSWVSLGPSTEIDISSTPISTMRFAWALPRNHPFVLTQTRKPRSLMRARISKMSVRRNASPPVRVIRFTPMSATSSTSVSTSAVVISSFFRSATYSWLARLYMTRGMSRGHIWQLRLHRNVSSTVMASGANALPSPHVYGTQYCKTFRWARLMPIWRSCFFATFLTTSMAMREISLNGSMAVRRRPGRVLSDSGHRVRVGNE